MSKKKVKVLHIEVVPDANEFNDCLSQEERSDGFYCTHTDNMCHRAYCPLPVRGGLT